MKVAMVSPHLPPDQAANALLPRFLGEELTRAGHEVTFVAFLPRHGSPPAENGTVYIRPPRGGKLARALRLPQASTAVEVFRKAGRALAAADVVHLHSNTFMNQVAAALAAARDRPFILTHYGTEIWHYRPGRKPFDPFRWMNERASHVTYYSFKLLEKSIELGLSPPWWSVIYPPVDPRFRAPGDEARRKARASLGVGEEPLLLNVKRLHPLADQKTLIEAMAEVRRYRPEARLWIAGEGESRPELERAIAGHGLQESVRLLGLVDNRELPRYYTAADLFVLPSLLEAFPTVAAEALACGTPMVSADHPGGVELKELFPDDVELVPRQNPGALAVAIAKALRERRRSSAATLAQIEEELRPPAVFDRYLRLYRRAACTVGGVIA